MDFNSISDKSSKVFNLSFWEICFLYSMISDFWMNDDVKLFKLIIIQRHILREPRLGGKKQEWFIPHKQPAINHSLRDRFVVVW